jgi:hypothetical protein
MATLNTTFEGGPPDWSARREALLTAFWRPGKRERSRFIQIDRQENPLLIRALAGKFRYPKHPDTGRVVMTIEAAKKASGDASHVPDALGHALSVLYPAAEWLSKQMQRTAPATPDSRGGSWLSG